VRRLEKLLGGNATTVEAGAANLVALDQSHIEAGSCAVECGGVTTGTATNYDHIKGLNVVRHEKFPSYQRYASG
jgi:hypothetical protein